MKVRDDAGIEVSIACNADADGRRSSSKSFKEDTAEIARVLESQKSGAYCFNIRIAIIRRMIRIV